MKALVLNNTVIDIEKRDIDVFGYYHEDIAKLFIDCSEDVNIGDIYINGNFEKPNTIEPEVNE